MWKTKEWFRQRYISARIKLSTFWYFILVKVGWVKVFNLYVDKNVQHTLNIVAQLDPNPRNRFIVNISSGGINESIFVPDYVSLHGPGLDVYGVKMNTLQSALARLHKQRGVIIEQGIYDDGDEIYGKIEDEK